jgi:hypothetical protein
LLYSYYRLDQAVAAGAEYAALNAANVNATQGAALATAIATAVESANGTAWANDTVVMNDGPSETVSNGKAMSGGTAANANDYYCLTGSPPNWSWGTGYTSQQSCGGGAGKFVTVTASYNYVPLLKIYGFLVNTTLKQNAAIQVQ